MERAFRQGWPEADAEVTRPEVIKAHIGDMVGRLDDVVARLRRRLRWARAEIERLNEIRKKQGTLEPEDEAIFRRCDALVKRLKGVAKKKRREAEGYDDVNTFGVLAAEGFLPGYGLEVGSILGTAEIPYWSRTGEMEFALPRPPSVALREYVPGNLIYANGHRFVARRFHREIDEDKAGIPNFEISIERQAVKEVSGGAPPAGMGAATLPAISVSDVELVHQSHISDEEEVRFQLGVAVYGMEKGQHNGGRAYAWGAQSLHHRRGVRLRLVNVGAPMAIERFERFGYPVCLVCGQSVSPLSSERQLEHFVQSHEERCGKKVGGVGFYADVVADALSLPACPDHITAFSVLEALRLAAARVLDMHLEDLQVLVVGHVDRDDVDAYLWDPMPGGSGLLDQVCERFEEIRTVALDVVKDCPAACETSCIDCLQTFHNSFYHKYLNRKVAQERLEGWGERLVFSYEIPAVQQPETPVEEGALPVNEAERRLQHLLVAAGFPDGIRGEQIRLDRAIGTTTPDVIYRAPHHARDEGICIYLDGLSGHLHGNPATKEHDQRIRTWLRNNGYEVIEIAASDLFDQGAMTRHFRKLAGYLNEAELRERLRGDESWFSKAEKAVAEFGRFALRIIKPRTEKKYVGCLPLIPLKAAAGAFSESQDVGDEWDWVEIETGHKLRPGMFVSQVVGKSMETAIPDGSYCIFRAPLEGTRQGKIVFVQLRDVTDPETGGRYTVKRYQSEKAFSEDGTWRHMKISLKPINPDFKPIEFTADDEGNVSVIAEFIEVIS